MSLLRHCDACGREMDRNRYSLRGSIMRDTHHIASVSVTVLTRSGAEDVCLRCVLAAIEAAVPEDQLEGEAA